MKNRLPFNPELKSRSRELRKAGNLSEALLWRQLKESRCGVLFGRQKIIGNYIVDFYAAETKTVIEIDGESHNNKADYDKQRDIFLQGLGLNILHISDTDVKRNMDGVMLLIERHIQNIKASK